MTELRTLKDLEYVDNPKDDSSPLIVKSEKLRKEAINWIKLGLGCSCNGCLHAVATFKDFFNITMEELNKNG